MSVVSRLRAVAAMMLLTLLLGGCARGVAHDPQRVVNEKDGSVLVLVPAGAYPMGSNDGASHERPPHVVTLSAFYIGRCEVTNAQFRRFVTETGYACAGDWEAYAVRWGEQAPVVRVSWMDAVAYTKWAGLRLPTEAEWEAAARGSEGRAYPWGETWDPSLCRSSVGGAIGASGGPAPVGSFPAGASPFGCLDMAGNVWEWCASLEAPYPYRPDDGRERMETRKGEMRVARGGSWSYVRSLFFRGANRDWFSPRLRSHDWGFRCARSL